MTTKTDNFRKFWWGSGGVLLVSGGFLVGALVGSNGFRWFLVSSSGVLMGSEGI